MNEASQILDEEAEEVKVEEPLPKQPTQQRIVTQIPQTAETVVLRNTLVQLPMRKLEGTMKSKAEVYKLLSIEGTLDH